MFCDKLLKIQPTGTPVMLYYDSKHKDFKDAYKLQHLGERHLDRG